MKKMRNKARAAGKGADRPMMADSFGRKGERKMKNEAPASRDKLAQPVSEDAQEGKGLAQNASASEYDPASGKRAKSVADLRSALKKLSERSDADGASPTGSEGGQDAKHMSSSKNSSGLMKTGEGELEKKSGKKPRALASQDADDEELEDPMDADQEDNEQAEEGMTPNGKSRKSTKGLMAMRKQVKFGRDI